MMKNNERMTRWLLDAIDTEIAKPDGEADMALVEECTALLEELNGASCTLTERELTKRCKAITRGKTGGKSAKKRVRLVAAIAACLAVFVFVCGCGYLPSINVILQTLFASGVGKDVEVHEVTYTFDGMSTQYENIDQLISSEKLDILIPTALPENTYITKILNNPEKNIIYILFNDTEISFQIFITECLEDLITISTCSKYENEFGNIYIKELSNNSHVGCVEINGNTYYMEHSHQDTILQMLQSLR